MMSDYADNDYAMALGKEVAIADVDKELRLLWEEDKASTNASLINLAVYSEQKGAIIKNSEHVQIITREHACRAILIGIDRNNPDASIRAWITAHCHLSHGRKSVCCEQIAFQLTGKSTGRLRNTVFSHLNSDLPLVFWWQGELSSLFSERLYPLMALIFLEYFLFNHLLKAKPVNLKKLERLLIKESLFLVRKCNSPISIRSFALESYKNSENAGSPSLIWIVPLFFFSKWYDLGRISFQPSILIAISILSM